MRARSAVLRLGIVVFSLLLAACGGGGGGSSSSVLPATGGAPPPAGGSGGTASVAFTIQIPSASPSGAARRPRYVSAGTKSISLSYGANRQVADCTTTCSLQANVTPGTVTFAVGLYDASGASGHLLASGSTTTTIVAGQQNSVNVTFSGVIASVAVALGSTPLTAGTPSTIPVVVTAKDAAGYTIVGSDPYATPISLSVDNAAAASLSTTSVSAPSAPVTLAYNGAANVAALQVFANVAGSNVSVTPARIVVQVPVSSPPASGVPKHVATYYFYGINDVNASIPASWMAAHADYVEDDGDGVQHASAFKAAGGKYAVSYTDPAYVPYCFAPFVGSACRGQVGRLISDETAWFHGSDGTRVRRYVDAHFGYQEALNPASPTAQAAYRQTTQAILANGPIDYFFADDSGGVYIGSDGTEMTGWFYGFNAAGTEISTDADFIAAEKKMLAASVKPVVLNGSTPYTMLPSYNGTWLDSPNVAAQNFEGCFSDGSGVAGPNNNRWVFQSNALLATYAHGTKAVCMLYASPTPSNRVYGMASWWITYNEQYSVIAPYTSYPLRDGYTVVPEYDIVPTRPLATATTDVSAMRAPGGAYVREFGACYQAGVSIGPCAAVVNASTSSEPLPALSGRYTSALALDDTSAYSGGKATWTGTIPASLAPQTALVLR
jgi:hypothetical protein